MHIKHHQTSPVLDDAKVIHAHLGHANTANVRTLEAMFLHGFLLQSSEKHIQKMAGKQDSLHYIEIIKNVVISLTYRVVMRDPISIYSQ